MEVRSKRSENPLVESLDKLGTLADEHYEKSGTIPKWLKQNMEDKQKEEEFDIYVQLLREAKSHFGVKFWGNLILYITEHHGNEYYMSLCSRLMWK